MHELYLQWSLVFGIVLGGILFLIGILSGVRSALRQIYGSSSQLWLPDSDQTWRSFSLFLLHIGVLSALGGVLWLYVFYPAKSPVDGIFAGGIFGLITLGFIRKLHQWLEERDLPDGIVTEIGGVRGIAPIVGGIAVILMYVVIGGILGTILGGFIGLLLGLLVGGQQSSAKDLILSGMVGGGIIGAIGGGFRGVPAGVNVGGKSVAETVNWITVSALVGGFGGGLLLGFSGMIPGAGVGIIAGGIASGLSSILLLIARIIARMVSAVITPFLILSRFETILCNHCLRYTKPLRSKYKAGCRYCERCLKEVEFTTDPGEVLLVFGDLQVNPEGRTFILVNPDFEEKTKPIEVAAVYVDTASCDQRLLERFLTYIFNYPPESGIQTVQICHRGELDALGENLKNALRNNFMQIEKLPEMY